MAKKVVEVSRTSQDYESATIAAAAWKNRVPYQSVKALGLDSKVSEEEIAIEIARRKNQIAPEGTEILINITD